MLAAQKRSRLLALRVPACTGANGVAQAFAAGPGAGLGAEGAVARAGLGAAAGPLALCWSSSLARSLSLSSSALSGSCAPMPQVVCIRQAGGGLNRKAAGQAPLGLRMRATLDCTTNTSGRGTNTGYSSNCPQSAPLPTS